MGLTDRISTAWRVLTAPDQRDLRHTSWDSVLYNGVIYQVGLDTSLPYAKQEDIGRDFTGVADGAFKNNGVVFSCILTRLQVFSQARFMWQSLEKGQPGDLFGSADLRLLEKPWPGATTGDLLAKMLVDADLAGNGFLVRRPNRIRRMRPDWVSIVVGSENDPDVDGWDLDADVLGYIYHPGGRYSGRKPVPLLREDVAHFAPIPDPTANYRGMSWISPIIRETMADSAATSHKLRFFENGATPNLVIKRADSPQRQAFEEWTAMMEAGHAGVANAYKTLYLTAGADATVVGRDLQQLEFKATQGAGETRIAAAAGVHPVIVGLSEGMQGSSLNAGNFGSARRLVADKTLWHLWGNAAGSIETIMPAPGGSRLWIDDRHIPFLREDRKDAAEIQQIKAATIRQLVDAGYVPESVVKAVNAEDMSLLKHSNLYSVQLQPPNTDPEPAPTSLTVKQAVQKQIPAKGANA